MSLTGLAVITNHALTASALESSDKLSSQPRSSREPHPRAQGLLHMRALACAEILHLTTACPLPTLFLPWLSDRLHAAHRQPLVFHASTRPVIFSEYHSRSQIIRTLFHRCFILNWESLLLLYTSSASSWYHIYLESQNPPRTPFFFCLISPTPLCIN